jgi:hypothetical protein
MIRFREKTRRPGIVATTNTRVSMSAHGLVEATQAEAEGGTVTGRYMSPLRTAQALSVYGSALSKVDDTNVTLTLGGSPGTAVLHATSITVGWSGVLSVARGGIGGGWSNTRLAKTTAYSVVNADKGKTISLAGNNYYDLTFNAPSGYDADFSVRVTNEDTARAKKIVISGGTSFKLYPGQTTLVYNQNNVWKYDADTRWKLTAPVTFFVSTTGSDSNNDGLVSGSAFATIQNAVNVIFSDLDCNLQAPSIQLANGTYIETVSLVRGPVHGYHFINILGNAGSPSSVIWEASGSGICLSCRDYGIIVVSGIKFQAAGGGTTNGCIGLLASQWGNIDFSNCDFGAFPAGNHIMVQSGGGINPTGSYSVSGSASAHMYCFGPGHILTSAGMTGGLTMSSAWVQIAGPAAVVSIDPSMSFAGAGAGAGTTGMKFFVHPLSDLQLNGVTLPGATNGSMGFGYSSGQGGTVTQATNKATAVTLNKLTGAITMNNALLAAATIVSFTLNDTFISTTDLIAVAHESGGTTGAYTVNGRVTGAGTAAIDVRNNTAGGLSEALVIRFSIIKSTNA